MVADAEDGTPDVLLLATGSEVLLCIDARERLANERIKAPVVTMPSWEIFERYCRDHPRISRAGAAAIGRGTSRFTPEHIVEAARQQIARVT